MNAISVTMGELAYVGVPILLLFAGLYLLIAVPVLAFIGLSFLVFLAVIRDARKEARKTCGGLFVLSIVHLVIAIAFLGGDSPQSSPGNAFEFFWGVALVCAPVFFALAALLPAPHEA